MKKFFLVFPILIVFCVIISVFLYLKVKSPMQTTQQARDRTLSGISGFTPLGFPQSNESQINDFFETINSTQDIYGVHSSLANSGILGLTTNKSNLPIELVIDYSDAQDVDKIKDILNKYKSIQYLAIGNEVNLLEAKDSEAFNLFVTNYINAYDILKSDFPNLKIYTTFQYEALVGKAYLTGIKYENNLNLLKRFDGKLDLIGITLYPHFDYDIPSDIPLNYFDELYKSGLKIAVTETGWPSNISGLSDSRFNTNEKEQEDYAKWVKALPSEKFEFINWIFLNDISQEATAFDGIGLRDINGKAKPALDIWLQN